MININVTLRSSFCENYFTLSPPNLEEIFNPEENGYSGMIIMIYHTTRSLDVSYALNS